MATLLVTGARGLIGSWATRQFAEQHSVIGVDRTVPPAETVPDSASFYSAQLTDYGAVTQLVSRVAPDAVVHCAAIPRAGLQTAKDTVENNTLAAYNVLAASGRAGIDCCWTSSEAVYGDGWAKLAAIPVTETSPLRPHNGYALSKVLGETVADYVVRRFEQSIVTVRPTWVNAPGAYGTAATRAAFDPETTTPADIAAANLWSYVDVRDLVALIDTAVNRLLTEDIDGHDRVLAAAPETYLERPTREAVAGVFDRRVELAGTTSIYDTTKAADRYGWTAEHSWQSAETAADQTPSFQA